MRVLFLCLAIMVTPLSAGATYKDFQKEAPVWSRPAMSMHHIFIVQKIMGIGPIMDILPTVRIWKNISSDDRAQCTECDGSYDAIVGDEIWLRDNATRRDMILMIVRFYQLYVNGIPYSMIDSSLAENERIFITKRWESTLQSKRERRPVDDVP